MTIFEYINGLVSYKTEESTVNSALYSIRNISGVFSDESKWYDIDGKFIGNSSFDISELTEKGADLTLANCYYFMQSLLSGGGERVTRGHLTVQSSSYTIGVNDRNRFKKMGDELYARWGEILEEDDVIVFPKVVHRHNHCNPFNVCFH